MKISHIVTNGCSFTYCQGLENPIKQGWPALIANKLNCPLVNLALPGVGNDNIHRRTYEYFFKSLNSCEEKPLYIISWSQPWRREAWYNTKDYNDFGIIAFPRESCEERDHYQNGILEHWSEEEFCRKTLLYKLSLISLFDRFQIPYVMTNYASMHSSNEIEYLIKEKFKEMVDATENRYILEDFCTITHSTEKLPCGHDGAEGQIKIANYLFTAINEIFPNVLLMVLVIGISLTCV